MSKYPKKLIKIVNIEEQILQIFRTHDLMKISGKAGHMIILKVTKKQNFTLSLIINNQKRS